MSDFLTVEDIRAAAKSLRDAQPLPGQNIAFFVHPRHWASALWRHRGQRLAALAKWIEMSVRLRLSDSEVWYDRPWRHF